MCLKQRFKLKNWLGIPDMIWLLNGLVDWVPRRDRNKVQVLQFGRVHMWTWLKDWAAWRPYCTISFAAVRSIGLIVSAWYKLNWFMWDNNKFKCESARQQGFFSFFCPPLLCYLLCEYLGQERRGVDQEQQVRSSILNHCYTNSSISADAHICIRWPPVEIIRSIPCVRVKVS